LISKELDRIEHYNYKRRKVAKVYDFEFANFLNPVVLMREEE